MLYKKKEKKTGVPATAYGPMVTLERNGYQGKIIKIYKLWIMSRYKPRFIFHAAAYKGRISKK
jgi:hypothetical protein